MAAESSAKKKGVVDLVILLDVTASMQECIEAVKRNVVSFITTLSTKNENNESPVKDWRIKVCGYRDQTYDSEWFVDNPFVNGIAAVQGQLQAPNMQASGGGDEPESLLDALYKVAEMGATGAQDSVSPDRWRPLGLARRVVVFFTDATFKTPMTTPEKTGGQVGDVITAILGSRLTVIGFAPEWSGYVELCAADRFQLEPYVIAESCPALAGLGKPGEEGKVAQRAAVQALKDISADSKGFKDLMIQLAKTVSQPGAEPEEA